MGRGEDTSSDTSSDTSDTPRNTSISAWRLISDEMIAHIRSLSSTSSSSTYLYDLETGIPIGKRGGRSYYRDYQGRDFYIDDRTLCRHHIGNCSRRRPCYTRNSNPVRLPGGRIMSQLGLPTPFNQPTQPTQLPQGNPGTQGMVFNNQNQKIIIAPEFTDSGWKSYQQFIAKLHTVVMEQISPNLNTDADFLAIISQLYTLNNLIQKEETWGSFLTNLRGKYSSEYIARLKAVVQYCNLIGLLIIFQISFSLHHITPLVLSMLRESLGEGGLDVSNYYQACTTMVSDIWKLFDKDGGIHPNTAHYVRQLVHFCATPPYLFNDDVLSTEAQTLIPANFENFVLTDAQHIPQGIRENLVNNILILWKRAP
jgi:hypothetical protein